MPGLRLIVKFCPYPRKMDPEHLVNHQPKNPAYVTAFQWLIAIKNNF